MNQKSEDNKISLGELMEEYRKKRKESSKEDSVSCCCLLRWIKIEVKRIGEGSDPSLLSRWIKVGFKRKCLLDQEFLFQDKMRKDIRKIIKSNKLTPNQLKEYSHVLKTLTKKYSKENTHFLLVAALIILIFSAVGLIIKIFLPQLTGHLSILAIAMFFFSLIALIGRIIINESVLIDEELILLIDEYIDSRAE